MLTLQYSKYMIGTYIGTLYVEHGADLPTVCAMLKLDCDAEKYQLNVAEMLQRFVR